jgi:hypothetical protein
MSSSLTHRFGIPLKEFTLKMATLMFAETLENLQVSMQVIPKKR